MIKAIYYYAISFITLIMVIGGGISLFYSLGDFFFPAAKEAYDYYASTNQDQALNNAIQSLGWIVIPGPIFYFTQKRIRAIKVTDSE